MRIVLTSSISFSSQEIAEIAVKQAKLIDTRCEVTDIKVSDTKHFKRIAWSNGYIADITYTPDKAVSCSASN